MPKNYLQDAMLQSSEGLSVHSSDDSRVLAGAAFEELVSLIAAKLESKVTGVIEATDRPQGPFDGGPLTKFEDVAPEGELDKAKDSKLKRRIFKTSRPHCCRISTNKCSNPGQ